nr:lipoyl(octanoyl) transferase LipB [Buchnera aphidicola]
MNIIVRHLGLFPWSVTAAQMEKFTKNRNKNTIDELWLVEHYPIFTYGVSENSYSMPNIKNIPVVPSSRGGKITYHGPGQLIIYFLLDLRRKNIRFYELVKKIEIVIIHLLKDLKISSHLINGWPGVYVKKKKFVPWVFG